MIDTSLLVLLVPILLMGIGAALGKRTFLVLAEIGIIFSGLWMYYLINYPIPWYIWLILTINPFTIGIIIFIILPLNPIKKGNGG